MAVYLPFAIYQLQFLFKNQLDVGQENCGMLEEIVEYQITRISDGEGQIPENQKRFI